MRGDANTPLSPDRFLAELTLVWLIMSPLFFVRHSTPVLIHYHLVALPALALVAGASTRLSRRLSPLIAAVMLALAGIWTTQIARTLDDASETRPVNSALSSILRESRQAAYESEPPVLFFTHGDDPAIDGEVAVFEALLWERPHRVINGDVLLILPPHPATLLATLAPFQAWEVIEAAGLATDVIEYPRREGALPFVATAYDGASDPAGFTAVDPVTFADGTVLEGWRVRRVGDRLRVSTLWRATALPADATIQQFHHLRTADTAEGEPLMVSDVPLSIHTWRSGDRVVVMADFFDVPPGEGYTVDIGHYTLPDVSRIAIEGSDQTHVRLGAFAVDAP